MHHLVFVFGTLKQGFPNHHIIAQQSLLGEYETAQPYPLYLVGERHSPWMLDQPGQGLKVTGQVFKVDDDSLAAMDKLERIHCADGYRRLTISVIKKHSNIKTKAFCYLKPPQQINRTAIHSGLITEYLLEHASKYRSRKIRN